MWSLLIETSTERGIVALVKEGIPQFYVELPYGYQNSKFLLPEIDAGLKTVGLAVKDLSYVAVGIGPGSYTGIRVGAATAKALTFACKIPLIGISTLHTFFPPEEGPFAVMIDAKIGGIYLMTGTRSPAGVTYASSPAVVAWDQLEKHLEGIEQWVTPNATALKIKWASQYPALVGNWHEVGPDPRHMDRLAREKFTHGDFNREGQLSLLYLRKTQAEIEKGR